MTKRVKLSEGKPSELTDEQRRRLEAMSDAEINEGALADADNPPLSENELMSVKVKRVRKKLGLSQADFAARFRINIARLKDIEQGRTRKRPDPALMAYLSVIEREPEAVDRALANDG
jgi:putative transcriptional regulator